MTRTLSQIADQLALAWEGPDVMIERPALVGDTVPGSLTLATTPRYAREAQARGAAALLTPTDLPVSMPALRSDHPRLAFARLLSLFHERPAPKHGIHPSAIISPNACVEESVSIGAFSVVEDGASIGARSVIGPNAYIGPGTRLGVDCVLGPGAVVYDGCTIGDRVRLQASTVIGSEGFGYEWDGHRHVPVPHIGTVVLEDDVEIGANACVDRAKTGETRIGRGTKIDNLVQVGHGVRIGPNCLLVSQVGLAGSVVMEAGVALGGQAGVTDNVTIGAGATIAAQSGVTGDLRSGVTYMGFPAREAVEMRRVYAAESRLPEIIRRLRALEQRLGDEVLEEPEG